MDGEDVGRRELGEVIWYKEEKKHLRELQRRERLEGRGSIVDVPEDEPEITSQEEPIPDLELEALLPPEDVESIKLALNSLELENIRRAMQKKGPRNGKQRKPFSTPWLLSPPYALGHPPTSVRA
ncbi:hypothetical protein NLJ89_g12157 [Agrocybe chaxingu]|uniref:Uncharacterized protein n=1 Tax=Agrocybe chaxingu TaxID=84603 RepID=A0A9W8JKI4_9AGAR|nr:hypothetical protein NLJ89_g12157 [Agrocybe chaxingu]